MTALALRGFRSRTLLATVAAGVVALTSITSADAGNFQINQNVLGQLQDIQLQVQPQTTQIVSFQQGNGLRFLDAHEDDSHDWAAVTRPYQSNTSQNFVLTDMGNGTYRIMQVNTGRYLDAHEGPDRAFRVVTRPFQDNTTQLWRLVDYGGGFYTIQQVSSGRFVNNNNSEANDFPVYTTATMYEGENNATVWRMGDAH